MRKLFNIIINLLFIILVGIAVIYVNDYKPVHPALWTIGKNKKEFQKVYDYYNKPEDSLKLKAAEFLIQNLDKHFYYHPKNEIETDLFFHNLKIPIAIDSFSNPNLYWWMRDELMNIEISKGLANGNLPHPKYKRRTDLKNINAEFLIENIEYAFKAWEFPWAQTYSFDVFCKYILPYRYGNEVPESWRKNIYEQYKWITDSLTNKSNALQAASFINKQFQFVLSASKKLPDNGFRLKISNQLHANVYGNCVDAAGLGVCILRSLGIASTVVSIPYWGNRASGHQLTGTLDSENKWHYFDFGELGPEINQNLTPPKIFLTQFDKMHRFKPVYEDVSSELMEVIDLEVEVNSGEDKDIYLCVFGDLSWAPIFKGEKTQSKVKFKNIGKEKYMYLAAVKSRNRLKPVSKVFSADSTGSITYYEPNYSRKISATFSRKHPYLKNKNIPRLKSLIGGKFSVSDNEDFFNKKELYKIEEMLNYDINIIECSEQTGKFLRYDFPQSQDSVFDGPAEVSFYTINKDKLEKIHGKYYGSPQLSSEHIQFMTDSDMLSYIEVWDCQKELDINTGKFVLRKDKQPIWLAMELDSATTVTHIGICPRNDKNGIYPGMRYELFYWDNEWISLGVKVAKSNSITYDEIPENALLWLRNLDEGKEERIFTLVNDEQVWW